jgi:hypothetical protein
MEINPVNLDHVKKYVEQNIGEFHKSRLDNLKKLKLTDILRRKNPYLYKAKNILLSDKLTQILLEAHLSSQEEGIFGNFLEGLAIFINKKVYGGQKSSAAGIDLEFENEGKRHIVVIKSGPNWGNSRQLSKMKDDFLRAKRTLRTSNSKMEVVAVNGCCYGRDNQPDKGDYFKLCGQKFWEFVSGNRDFYTDIIEPLGYKAREKNKEFEEEYSKIRNLFTQEFCAKFCIDGSIDWNALVRFNSSEVIIKAKK